MDPGQNGALAQWAIGAINERLEATVELNEEQPEEDEQTKLRSHSAVWSCSQLPGETVATGTGPVAAESRRQAMAALYRSLPQNLESVYLSSGEKQASASQSTQALAATGEKARYSEVNIMHNFVVQKMGVKAMSSFSRPAADGDFECALTWSWYDAQQQAMRTEKVVGVAKSKRMAQGRANEQMLHQQGHLPMLSEERQAAIDEIRSALKEKRVRDAASNAIALVESSEALDSYSLSLFLPEVMRSVLAEGDSVMLHDLLAATLRSVQETGIAVETWEALLDEASLAVRHYFMASSALEQLANFPLADAFPSQLEKDYFRRFRSLLALERHGGLMHGIQQYELDPQAHCSVPTVEVHDKQASMVVLTSPPGQVITELVDGARALKTSDLVLLVPSEAAEDAPSFGGSEYFGEVGNTSGWQHPEAWLASVTSVTGTPRFGEEVRIHTRRISSFSSDVEDGSKEDGARTRPSPISIGRQFRIFYVAMETPLSRQLAALRCVSQVKLPAWSEGFEGRRPTYAYSQTIQRVLLAEAEGAQAVAQEPVRAALTAETAQAQLERLKAQRSWLAALTGSQHGAVCKALEQRLSLIQGPPGTGKTFVACAVVAAWLDTHGAFGDRILAVADSNVAADNLHVRLQKFGIESVRVGQGKEVDSRPGGPADQMWKAAQSARVVVATCIGSGMEILNGRGGDVGSFQRVIVDECTQACEPAVLVPLGRRCEQVVLIGDHAQLPATVLSKAAQREGLGLSLFERMVNQGLSPTVLLEQRRMHSSIADFPNSAFYGGQLVNAADDSSLTAVPGFPWPNPDCRVGFVDVAAGPGGSEGRRGFSAFNTAEAEAVATVLEGVIRGGYPPQQIVVLTAYLAQKQEITRAIRDRGMGSYLEVISVDTVDGYQGMEQGLVLFSATRNNEARALGFLADTRRMNVMLTRAKQGLIVFGNSDTLRHSEAMQSRWPAWLDWVEQRGSVIAGDQLSQPSQHAFSAQPQAAHSWSQPQETAPGGTQNGRTWDDLGDLREAATGPSPGLNDATATPPGSFPPPPLPPSPPVTVWQQVYSEEHKAHYYWNKETNLTQWEAPQNYAPAV